VEQEKIKVTIGTIQTKIKKAPKSPADFLFTFRSKYIYTSYSMNRPQFHCKWKFKHLPWISFALPIWILILSVESLVLPDGIKKSLNLVKSVVEEPQIFLSAPDPQSRKFEFRLRLSNFGSGSRQFYKIPGIKVSCVSIDSLWANLQFP
jgi:hypothetical protein